MSDPAEAEGRRPRLAIRIIGTLLPSLLLWGACEVGVVQLGLDQPKVKSKALPEELFGVIQPDADLFWSLKPGLSIRTRKPGQEPAEIRTNSLGLRGPEIAAKQASDYRILSLGESTTFGAYVGNEDTYSAQLEKILNERAAAGTRFEVINGGVSAYSSFQSLTYLKLRGWELQPDLVLFYHEFNDYLPSSLRSSSNDELAMARTDRELYESRSNQLLRFFLDHSGVARALVYWLAGQQVTSETPGGGTDPESADPGTAIGLLRMGALPGLVDQGDEATASKVQHGSLPRRVSEAERQQNFEDLAGFCEEQGIEVVVIHPAYYATEPHECLLTDFCRDRKIPMYEAYHALREDGIAKDDFFVDLAHPSPLGHRRLAEGLAEFLAPRLEGSLQP